MDVDLSCKSINQISEMLGNPIESQVMLLGAETLESQQKAQKCFYKQ